MDQSFQNLPYYCGISGLQLPIPKYKFPEEHQSSSRLVYYSTFFNSIEINSTFYKLPLGTTLDKWSKSVNDNFRFTLKIWKQVTHNKGLQFASTDIIQFLNIANNIGLKKGCLLVQLPPSVNVTYIDQLAELLSLVKTTTHGDWTVAVEFRNLSWYHDDVYALMQQLESIIVIHDKARCPSPFLEGLSSTLYLRFHGPTGDYRGNYSDEFLREYALYIHEWLTEGKTVYVYFNNTMGNAFNNLITLNKFIKDASSSL